MNKSDTFLVDKARGFIFALTLMEAPVFFSIYALTGRTYIRSDSSSTYVIYMVVLLAIQILFLICSRRIRITNFIWLLTPLLFVGLSCLTAILKQQPVSVSNIRNIILWQYTGILLAININTHNLEEEIKNSLVFLMLITTMGSIVSVLLPFLRGRQIYSIAGYSLTGSSFQAQTYNAALCVGINLFFILFSNKSGLVKIESYFLLGVQLICIILYAGRGGMLLALVFIIVFYMLNTRKGRSAQNRVFMIILYLALFITLFYVLRYIVASNPVLQQRFGRIFSYIGSGGIDMSQTSNRDIVYSKAIYYIKKSPILGYGILGYMYLDEFNRYPHNIVMEMILEGGIGYSLIWGYIIIFGFRKMRLKGVNTSFLLFLIPFMFAIIKLMFSGSYSYEMLFWFSVVYSHIYGSKGNYSYDSIIRKEPGRIHKRSYYLFRNKVSEIDTV